MWELLLLIWLGIVPGAVVVTVAVNLAVNNATTHRQATRDKALNP